MLSGPRESFRLVRSRLVSIPRVLTLDAKVLGGALTLLAVLCAYRSYNYWITGFFVSDEFGYFHNAANGAIYGDRWFFGWLNIFLFKIFAIRTPDSFAFFLPFYLFLWSGLTIYVFYRLLKLQGFSDLTVALSIVCSFVLVAFVLLSLGFLTDGVGLCMAMLGIYGLVGFLKSETDNGRFAWLVFAALFLGFAGGTREPYVAVEIGGIAVIVIAALRHPAKLPTSRYGTKSLSALSILFFLVPTGLMLYANTATTSTVGPLASGLIVSIFTNPASNTPASLSSTKVVTQNVTQTVIRGASTTTLTTQSVSTTTQLVTQNVTQTVVRGASTTTLTTQSVSTTTQLVTQNVTQTVVRGASTTTLTTQSVSTTTQVSTQNVTQSVVRRASTTTLTPQSVSTTTQLVTQNVTQTVVRGASTTTLTTQSVSTTTQVSYIPFYGKSVLSNTIAIFIGGLFLGWGPIAFPLALVGFLILTKASIRREPMALAALVLVLSALGSDLVVSYLFAPTPDYLTFKNYSTIIRFSGTALPAFFMTTPFFLAVVAKRNRRVVGLLGIAVASLFILIPIYQVFAISNLGYTTVNHFGLGYRSPAVQVRDYVNGHRADAPFRIIGVPYGWYFTPGIDGLKSVDVYSSYTQPTLSPTLNYSTFLAQRWTEFYVYSSSSFIYERANSPYVLQFIQGAGQQAANQTAPFKIISSRVVINNPDFLLAKVDLSWSNAGP